MEMHKYDFRTVPLKIGMRMKRTERKKEMKKMRGGYNDMGMQWYAMP